MFSSALHELFGGRAAEAVLLHLFHHGETHGRALAMDFSVSLVSVQRQLERFARAGVITCRHQGRTVVYSWNPKSRLATRLRDLVAVVHEGMSPQAKAALFMVDKQPGGQDRLA